MALVLRRLWKTSSPLHSPPPQTHHRQLRRASFDATAVKFVRDRALDHAVERERNLRPLVNLKDLLKSEPSKSLPISVISQQRDSLRIPIRPIEFVRRYPSVFEEFTPGSIAVLPHVKLKDEVLELDAEEQLIYQSESFRKDAADRVLKLLMIARGNKVPLTVLDELMWDMGLPRDFAWSIVPEFPDYFRVVGGGDSGSDPSRSGEGGVLELVCWSNDHAVSATEKKGTPVVFPMNFSKGFEVDKKFQKWIDEWQRLPYVSPYEDGSHLGPQTDESDKWAVAVLHELLNLFVSKKTEKDNVLSVGDYLGIRSRFKRALLNHPGIFYLSNKLGTYTVVLKEAFKRASLIEEHPMMAMRHRYIHLMTTVKVEKKTVSSPSSSKKKREEKVPGSEEQVEVQNESEEEEDDDDDEDEDEDDDAYSMSNSESEDDDDVRESEARRNAAMRRGRTNQERDSNMGGRSISSGGKRMGRRQFSESEKNLPATITERREFRKGEKPQTSWKRMDKRQFNENEKNLPATFSGRRDFRQGEKPQTSGKRMDKRQFSENERNRPATFSGRREFRRGDKDTPQTAGKRMGKREFSESKNFSGTSSERKESWKSDKPRTRYSERSNGSGRSTSKGLSST